MALPLPASGPRSLFEVATFSELDKLNSDELTQLVERLTHHAMGLIRRHTWRGFKIAQGGSVPGGIDPADIASAAITDVIEGTRTWNQEVEPDLLAFLCSVVDSKVSHLVCCAENRVTRRMPSPAADEPEFDAPGREPDPAVTCAEQESLDRLRTAIRQEISGDKLVEGLFQCLDSGVTKPADIALLLDLKVADVNNGQKRLRRKVEALLKTPRNR